MSRRKIQTCIGFDAEVLDWLKTKPEGMSKFLNDLVALHMEESKSKDLNPKETAMIIRIGKEKKARKEAIKAVLVKNPLRWLVKVKIQSSSYTQALRTQISNVVKLDYNVKTNDDEITEVFHEVFKTFDWNTLPKEYKDHLVEQGIMKETKRGHAEFV